MRNGVCVAGRRVVSVASGLAIGVVFLLSGCASQAELPPQVSRNLVDLRDHVVRGKAQVQTTCNAARDLVQRPQADVQPQVDRLLREIEAMRAQAVNSRQQYANAQEEAKAYFAKWDQEMAGMSESMARAGQERRAESMASLESLKSRVAELKAEVAPFLTTLEEVGRYLKLDPTASGVSATKPKVEAVVDREKVIMKKADAVITQIDAMRGGK